MGKKKNNIQEKKSKEVPLATMVIREYKALNETYAKANKRLTILIAILLMLFAVETTYIVLYWDSIHPHVGIINTKCK